MPNPIAHPAAAIPFTRVGMVFSALVISSIAPDFGYWMPLPSPFFMYTIPGLFLFDIPMALVLLWLFHALIKWPLLSLLPESLQRRLFKHAQGFSFGPPKRFLLILLSLLVGSLTHIIWDSFTHVHGWMVRHFAFFSTPINGTPLYTILQYLGSALGIALLIYWFIQWLPAAPQTDQLLSRFSSKVQVLFLAAMVVSLVTAEGTILYWRIMSSSDFVSGHFLITSTIFSTGLVGSFFAGIYCVAWTIAFHKTLRSPV